MAAIYGDPWFAYKWPKGVDQLNIAVKGFIPVVITAKILVGGGEMASSQVLFRSDNMAIVECLKKKEVARIATFPTYFGNYS